jgi:TetR/AcrR family transcriptional regulator, cholesterol catabolism regulator
MTTGTETIDWRDCQPVELSEILRHSSEAFYEHGFHGTTVRDIAARVGVTVPALYYHHENKEAILVAVLEAAIADLQARGEAAIAEAGDDPAAQLANLVESFTLHLTVRARLAALDSEYRYLSADARAPYAELRKANELLTRSVIDRGVEAGVFHVDDTAEATRALLGMLQAIPRWYVDSGPLTPADVASRYVGLSLALMGAASREE